MKIIIDSNALIPHYYFLQGSNFELIKKFIKHNPETSLVLPKIVLEEVTNKYRKHLEEDYKNCQKLYIKFINKFPRTNLIKEPFNLDINEESRNYNYFLTTDIKEDFNLEIFDYCQISHERIVNRAILHKKPFDEKSEKGYRDSLIWESILDIAQKAEDEVVFITNNKKDFLSGETTDLHPELIADLEAINIPLEKIRVFKSIGDFVKEFILPKIKQIGKVILEENLKEYTIIDYLRSERESIKTKIETELENLLRHKEELEELSIRCLESPTNLEIVQTGEIEKDEVFVNFNVNYSIDVECLVLKSSYWSSEEGKTLNISIIDPDWNEHYILGETILVTRANFSATFNLEEKEFTTYELNEIELNSLEPGIGVL